MVIAIIALLVSILMPALSKAKDIAKSGVCMSNLRNMFPSLQMYMTDSNGFMTGWYGLNEPDPGQTAWFLELYRSSGGDSSVFPDSRAIFPLYASNDWSSWTHAMPILRCPNDTTGDRRVSSYSPNLVTWNYATGGKFAYRTDTTPLTDNAYHPTKTQFFNFSRMPRVADTVMLSGARYNNVFRVIDGGQLTGNCGELAGAGGPGTFRSRFYHPGAGKAFSSNYSLSAATGYEWIGTNSYLFFDGHVSLRQAPPYLFHVSGALVTHPYPPEGPTPPTYAKFIGQ